MTAIAVLCISAHAQKQSSQTLVAYFSATGTTEKAAKLVAETTGGTLFKIQPAQEYTANDLNWHNKSSRSSVEMADAQSRPALSVRPKNFIGYDTVYIGFPIWWNLAPRIINTFIESNDLAGKTVIPFCTSTSSGLGDSGTRLQKLAGTGNWQAGQRFSSGASASEVSKWVKSLKLGN